MFDVQDALAELARVEGVVSNVAAKVIIVATNPAILLNPLDLIEEEEEVDDDDFEGALELDVIWCETEEQFDDENFGW